MRQKLIAQGAEAKIILTGNTIEKNRIPKSYRIKFLDEKIRKLRTRSERKLLEKASKIINSPKPLDTEDFDKIKMPLIEGDKLSEKLNFYTLEKQKKVCKQIGEAIAKLHDQHIIHGDLTTSNMILSKNKIIRRDQKFKGGVDKGKLGSLYVIDFGLGYISQKFEDKAVDLHLLKQAFEAKHFKNFEILTKEIFKGYKKSENFQKTITQLEKVEKRRRYKH